MATTTAILELLLLYLFWISLLFLSGSLQLCIEKERKALLNVRSGFPDFDKQVSPWKGDECCRWERVSCNNITGHVIKLELSVPYGLSNTSEVHPSLFDLKHLKYLNIRGNDFDGRPIPSSIGSLTQLQDLDLSRCHFGGEIPHQLGNLSHLRYLSLFSNRISGKIPASFVHLRNLQFLYLGMNSINGEIPEDIGNLKNIEGLFLNGNQIAIPKEITKLRGHRFLNLSSNHFLGPIPYNISLIGQLESLDLSKNNLSGRIPSSISSLNFLSILNLSYNNLIGKIPPGTQLQTFTNLSYIGNSALCGEPLQTKCPSNNNANEEESMHGDDEHGGIWYFIGFAPGYVFGFWGFMGAVMIKRSTRIKYILIIDRICGWFMSM